MSTRPNAAQELRWFPDATGIWHRQAYANIADCGALAARGVGPWTTGRAPSNAIVCADCEPSGFADNDPTEQEGTTP